jgi:hypothetical protein
MPNSAVKDAIRCNVEEATPAVKRERCGNAGVIEYWSDGVMGLLKFQYSNTPILHHSGYSEFPIGDGYPP